MIEDFNMYDVSPIGAFFVVFVVFFIVAVVVYSLCSGGLMDWKRISEIKNMFKTAVKEIKKDIIELSSIVGNIWEVLSYQGGGREEELIILKSRARERIESIQRIVNGDFRTVEAFMKDVEAGRVLKSLSRDNVESFKKEMRQKQWLITCIKDYLVLLESSHEQLEVARGDACEKSDNDENASPTFAFKRILKKIMKQITAYETSESMKRQEELLRYTQYSQQHYSHYYNNRNPHNYNIRSMAPSSSCYSVQYSSSMPQFNSPQHDYYRDCRIFRN